MKNDEQNASRSSDKINTSHEEPALVENKPELEKQTFSERWKNSKYLFIRGSYIVLHSIWTVVMVIGMAIAWLVAVLAT